MNTKEVFRALRPDEFRVLMALLDAGETPLSQRNLAAKLDCSLGKINGIVATLDAEGLIFDMRVTSAGLAALRPYKVENAIIMAAGMSSRFAPLSYEKPKGVLVVKGEVLIERQIRQLQAAGISDITIVVGYKKEAFFYLQEKFGVEIVVNEDYYRYNNTSTLIRVLHKLGNTYICSSDNYFSENVFEPYVYDSYYSTVYMPGKTAEWAVTTNSKGRITKVDFTCQDNWAMMGHVYWSRSFSKAFSQLLVREYQSGTCLADLWEKLFARNLRTLSMQARHYSSDVVHEFDSLEELRTFDDRYLSNADSNIFRNICKVLKCTEQQIGGIEVIKQGMTNLSFKFTVKGKDYIYRHPGPGTDRYICRKAEAFSLGVAKKLNLDNTLVYMDASEGWKISHFLPDIHTLDVHNWREVEKAAKMIRKLHDAKVKGKKDFDLWKKTHHYIDALPISVTNYPDFKNLHAEMAALYKKVQGDKVPWVLCHSDCYDPNFLVDKKGNITLTDWEYSGNDDPATDLGAFICCTDWKDDEALRFLRLYYCREMTASELRHNLAYVALSSYHWYIWALYQENSGKIVGSYLLLWYRLARHYLKEAVAMYAEEKK